MGFHNLVGLLFGDTASPLIVGMVGIVVTLIITNIVFIVIVIAIDIIAANIILTFPKVTDLLDPSFKDRKLHHQIKSIQLAMYIPCLVFLCSALSYLISYFFVQADMRDVLDWAQSEEFDFIRL